MDEVVTVARTTGSLWNVIVDVVLGAHPLHETDTLSPRAGDVSDAVCRGLREPERFSQQRRRIASELFYCPGAAAARAVACVYDLLALPRPERLTAAASPVASPALTTLKRGALKCGL